MRVFKIQTARLLLILNISIQIFLAYYPWGDMGELLPGNKGKSH